MRVLFLDMDGVVNSARFFEVTSKRAYRRERGRRKAALRASIRQCVETGMTPQLARIHSNMIDPVAVDCLNQVLRQTGAQCVSSSSWRIGWPVAWIEALLCGHGFIGRVIDATPWSVALPPGVEPQRGHEIAAWLAAHDDQVEGFAIVDDGDDMVHLKPKLVQTTWAEGLRPEHIEPLVRQLRAPIRFDRCWL